MRILSRKKISTKELKIITKQLSSMLKSGCDIISCMDTIISSSSPIVVKAFCMTKIYIQRGRSMAESFAMSNYFSRFYISMVQAGELSGRLDYVFYRMSAYYDRQNKLKRKIIGACLYPIVLFLVSIFVVVFMLVFVVPNFEQAFSSYDGIDIDSIFIFKLSKAFREYYYMFFLGIIVFILYMYRAIRESKSIMNYMDNLRYSIPGVKKINQLYICDQYARVLSILIASGVNINDSMDISSKTINSNYLDYKLRLASLYVEAGNSVSKSLAKTGIFPDIFISMLLAGEESGDFDESLNSIAEYYEGELDIELENMTKLVEPVMLLLMGFTIGGLLVSILTPMFDMISSIS